MAMKKNRHHVIPRSRDGTDAESNIAKTDPKLHELYHKLFGNRTPLEIVHYLNKEFWNGNYAIEMEEKRR